MVKRILIIFALGFSSGLPLALLSTTLQAWFVDAGMSVLATGSLSLLGLPYILRFIWAPILDRYTLFSIGKRRSWILFTQIILLLGFNIMACLTPSVSIKIMVVLAFILSFVSALQDIAIDAHRVEYLSLNEHGIGAAIALIAYRVAMLIGGGGALIIAAHIGWAHAYRIMGMLMLLGLIAGIYSTEPLPSAMHKYTFANSLILPIKELMARQGTVSLIFFIFFYKLGEAFTTTSSGIVMPFLLQGLGFSLSTVAYTNNVLGICATLIGGLLAGIILLRWQLYNALLSFGLLQALTNVLFIILAIVGKNLNILASAIICDNFIAGMGSTALVALFMRVVDTRFTAAQFSILVALATIPRIVAGPVAAVLQSYLGWIGLYQCSFLLALAFVPFLMSYYKKISVLTHKFPISGRIT